MEGDTWNVIDPLRNTDMKPHWSIVEVVANILDRVKCLNGFSLSFSSMYKEGNAPAHLLAQWAAFVNLAWPAPIPSIPLLVARVVERDGSRPSLLLYSNDYQ